MLAGPTDFTGLPQALLVTVADAVTMRGTRTLPSDNITKEKVYAPVAEAG